MNGYVAAASPFPRAYARLISSLFCTFCTSYENGVYKKPERKSHLPWGLMALCLPWFFFIVFSFCRLSSSLFISLTCSVSSPRLVVLPCLCLGKTCSCPSAQMQLTDLSWALSSTLSLGIICCCVHELLLVPLGPACGPP